MYKLRFNFLRKLFQNEKVSKIKEVKKAKKTNKIEKVYGYDFDGVISIGVHPRNSNDVIITGRCIDEAEHVLSVLDKKGITNTVYFNPMTLEERGNHTIKARRFSGAHKAKTITKLKNKKIVVTRFFEDDTAQIKCISKEHPELDIVHIKSNLVEK